MALARVLPQHRSPPVCAARWIEFKGWLMRPPRERFLLLGSEGSRLFPLVHITPQNVITRNWDWMNVPVPSSMFFGRFLFGLVQSFWTVTPPPFPTRPQKPLDGRRRRYAAGDPSRPFLASPAQVSTDNVGFLVVVCIK